jgi:sirohydrochlorin ferrochelatase
MVSANVIRDEGAQIVQRQPLVVVSTTGTGIGAYALLAMARTCANNGGKGLRAYIIGRKPERVNALISDLQDIYPAGEYHFVKVGDMGLIKEVDTVCAEVTKLEEKHGQDARIDYLLLVHGGAILQPRKGELPYQ